jgi:hypothetical protein
MQVLYNLGDWNIDWTNQSHFRLSIQSGILVHLSVYTSIPLFIHPSLQSFVYSPIYTFIHPSIHPSLCKLIHSSSLGNPGLRCVFSDLHCDHCVRHPWNRWRQFGDCSLAVPNLTVVKISLFISLKRDKVSLHICFSQILLLTCRCRWKRPKSHEMMPSHVPSGQ